VWASSWARVLAAWAGERCGATVRVRWAKLGDAVGAAGDLGAREGEPRGGDLSREGVPESGGCFAFEQLRSGRRLDGVAFGLVDVEDVDHAEAAQDPAATPPLPGAAIGGPGVWVGSCLLRVRLVSAGGEKADGLLAAPHLVAEGFPGPVAHDGPGVGPLGHWATEPLGQDEQLIAEAVAREAGGARPGR
jgi:hypothetical protein